MELNKAIRTILIIIGVGLVIFFGYEYATEPKMVDGVLSKDIDEKGKPVEVTKVFTPEDSIYFSAKQNRFWIDEARIIWYKGDFEQENRILVQENVKVNDAKYFSAKLTIPEGLEEGSYGVIIYVQDKEIMEEKATFELEV